MTKLLLSSGGSSAVALKPLSLLRRSLLGIGTASILLGSFSLAQAATQSVSLAWNTSTDPSVVGYNVNYGTSSGSYTPDPQCRFHRFGHHLQPGRRSHLLFCRHRTQRRRSEQPSL